MKNISDNQRKILEYVAANPGCTKADAVRAYGNQPWYPGAYGPVNRLVARGLIKSERLGVNRTALTIAPEVVKEAASNPLPWGRMFSADEYDFE